MNNSYQEVKILLVEDDDIDALSVERALNKLKVANPLVRVKNGKEALKLLRADKSGLQIGKPYIILLDLNMPIMGGIEFLQEIRKEPKLSDSIVFVLTTSDADEDRVAAYKENIAGYIMKINSQEGMQTIVDMLDNYWRVVVLPHD